MKFVILPVGRMVDIPIAMWSENHICDTLRDTLHLLNSDIQLLWPTNNSTLHNTLTWPEYSEAMQTPLHVLVRCRGGVKGGFRKQLEKRGREFARARRKELKSREEAKRTDAMTANTDRDHIAIVKTSTAGKEGAVVENGCAVDKSQKKHDVRRDVAALAAQGVLRVIARRSHTM